MEYQLMLLAVAIVVVIALLVTCFLMLGTGEREFEQVYSNNQMGALFEKSSAPKPSKSKSKHKVTKTKHKELKAESSQPEDEEEPLVSEEPIIEEQQAPPPVESKPIKSKKQKRAPPPAAAEPEEQGVRSGTPDEHPQDPEVIEEKTEEEDSKPAQDAPSKKSKKKKKSEPKVQQVSVSKQDAAPVSYSEPDVEVLIEQLKISGMGEIYLSSIVECLLMKEQYTTQTAKNSEEMVKMRRELEAKIKQLQEQSQIMHATNQQTKDFKQQLESERAKSMALEKTWREQLAQKQTEVQSLSHRIHAYMQESSRMQEALRQNNPTIIEQLRQELQQQKERSVRLESEQHQRQEQLQHYQNDLLSRDQQVRLAEQKRQQSDKRVHEIQAELDKAKKGHGEVSELQKRLSDKESELSRTRKELSGLSDDYADLDSAVRVLRQSYEKAQSGLVDANNRLSAQTNGDVLNGENEEQLRASDNKKAELEKTVNELKAKLEEIQRAKDNSETKAKAVRTEAENHVNNLKTQLENLKAEKEEQSKKVERTKSSEIDALASSKSKLETQLRDLESQLKSATNDKQTVEHKMKELTNKLDSTAKKCDSLEQCKQSLEERLRQESVEKVALQQKANSSDKDKELSEAKNSISTLQQQLKEATVKLNLLEAQLPDQSASSVTFHWPEGPSQVSLTGSFWEWGEPRPLEKGTDGFNVFVPLESGQQYEFKFVVDGQWVCSDGYDISGDKTGNQNNTIQVTKQEDAVTRLEKQLVEKQKQIDKLTQTAQQEPIIQAKTVSSVASSPAAHKELDAKNKEIEQLNAQLETQKKKNNELRDKNYKTVGAVQELEKTSRKLLEQSEKDHTAALKSERAKTEKLLSQLLPEASKPEPETYHEWLHEIETLVKEKTIHTHTHSHTEKVVVQTNNDSSILSENKELKANLSQYQSALKEVESDLCRLESHAKTEETKWIERCNQLEKLLVKAKSEKSESPKPIKSTEEVRSHLSELEQKLKVEEAERDTLREQVIILQKDLETERITGRDLSSQAVKLRGMLKTGQDALQHEQQIVNELKTQLKNYQEGTGEYSLQQDMEQLKARLQKREDQLEKEAAVNKQLSLKLTSLGVQIHD